jgi:hypothetical protein
VQGAASASGPLDPRQVNSTLGMTEAELRALQAAVRGMGRNPNLANAQENITEALNAVQNGRGRFQGDPAEIEKLVQQILNPLREAEVDLAKQLEILVEKDKIRAALEDDTPAAFQNEVKAYYEAVGKGK